MNRNEREIGLRRVYEFMKGVYPANWQVRWGETPYMSSFSGQSEIDQFVSHSGKFESVPAHIWGCIGLWMNLRKICPSLDKLVDSTEVYERLWGHDLGETYLGDISLASKIQTDVNTGKVEEREEYIRLLAPLPEGQRERMTEWFDEFEHVEGDVRRPLEVLVARWIDHLQGDHFALVFGNDLEQYSPTIEKIVKKRSVLFSRILIDSLRGSAEEEPDKKDVFLQAADEVEDIARIHIEMIREAGIELDLTGLGFSF